MQKRKPKYCPAKLQFAVILFSLVLIHCSSLFAEEDTSPEDVQDKQQNEEEFSLPEIIVQDNKGYPKLKHDEAASGTVLLRKDFDDAAQTLPEVLDQQAGVRVTKMGGPSAFSTLSIRGSNSDQVLVVLDGIPLNSSSGGPVDLSRIPLGNVKRIEIYRGVAPIFFGNSSIGGVISISTRNGRKRSLTVDAGGGSFASREARLFFAEPSKKWDFALGLDYSGWEGGFSYTNDNGTRFDESDDFQQIRKNDSYNQLNSLLKTRFKLNNKWRLTVFDWLFFREQGIAGLGLFETEKPEYSVVDNLLAIKLEGMNLFEKLDWQTSLSLRFVWSRFLDPLSEIGLGTDNSKDKTYSPNLHTYLNYKAFKWFVISASASYRFEYFDTNASASSTSDSNRHSINTNLEAKFKIEAIDLVIIPSGRIEWAKSRLSASRNQLNGTAKNTTQLENSYRLSIVNSSIPDTKITVSGGRAVRLPSLFELFGNNGKVLGNSSLNSESSYNADAGIIYQSTKLPEPFKLKIELYAFFSQVDNLIQFIQTSQNVAVAENLDKTRLWGIEAGVSTDLFSHLRLNGNYTLLKSKNISNISARKGKVLPNRPASKWYVRAEGYFNDLFEIDETSLYLESDWIAGNFLDNANLVAVSDRFYFNAGFSFLFADKKAKLSFAANNLTNEQTQDLTGYPLPGRSYHLLFSLKVF